MLARLSLSCRGRSGHKFAQLVDFVFGSVVLANVFGGPATLREFIPDQGEDEFEGLGIIQDKFTDGVAGEGPRFLQTPDLGEDVLADASDPLVNGIQRPGRLHRFGLRGIF